MLEERNLIGFIVRTPEGRFQPFIGEICRQFGRSPWIGALCTRPARYSLEAAQEVLQEQQAKLTRVFLAPNDPAVLNHRWASSIERNEIVNNERTKPMFTAVAVAHDAASKRIAESEDRAKEEGLATVRALLKLKENAHAKDWATIMIVLTKSQ